MKRVRPRGMSRGLGGGIQINDARQSYSRVVELLLYAISPLATLVTAPLLAQGLGPVARGHDGVAVAVGTFAVTLGSWGQSETYLGEARSGRSNIRQQARISWWGGGAAGILSAVALTALGIPVTTSVLTAVWIPVLSQANLWRSVCIAFGFLKEPALFTALGPVLRIVALLGLTWCAFLNAESAVMATQLTSVVAAFGTMWLVVRQVPDGGSSELVLISALLRTGGSIIAFSVLNAITLRSDLVILQVFVSPHEVGLYAAPASLTTAALALSNGFKSRLQAAAFSEDSGTSVAREALPVLVLGTVGAGILWVIAPRLVQTFFGDEYQGSIILLRLLGVATVPLLLLDLAQGLLIVLAQRRQLISVGAVGAVTVSLSLALLCPPFGATGAAVACIVGYAVTAAVAWLVLVPDLRRGVTGSSNQ